MPVQSDRDALAVVSAWFDAFNRSDVVGLCRLYADDCDNEQAGQDRYIGRVAQQAWLTNLFSASEGAFEGAARRQVRTLASVEDGWTHAEWIGKERLRLTGETVTTAGYEHFLIESGAIRRQRGVAHAHVALSEPDVASIAPGEPPRRSRRYPLQPIVGVGAVIEQHGRVVLVRRRFEPLAGQWSLPGGTLELGETLEAGVAREMLEETGLAVDVGPVIDVFDRILLDEEHRVKYHFVLVDYLCHPLSGELRHGSDVDQAIFVASDALDAYHLTPKARSIIERALHLARQRA
jgi:mutator protein MutT